MMLPRIVYSSTTIDATLAARPVRHEIPKNIGGGIEFSASGVPASWPGRWERPLTVTQRITESEWPSFRSWLEHAMLGGSFTWADNPGGTANTCYLVSPMLDAGGEVAHLEYPGDQEFTYSIRRTDGAAIAAVNF